MSVTSRSELFASSNSARILSRVAGAVILPTSLPSSLAPAKLTSYSTASRIPISSRYSLPSFPASAYLRSRIARSSASFGSSLPPIDPCEQLQDGEPRQGRYRDCESRFYLYFDRRPQHVAKAGDVQDFRMIGRPCDRAGGLLHTSERDDVERIALSIGLKPVIQTLRGLPRGRELTRVDEA